MEIVDHRLVHEPHISLVASAAPIVATMAVVPIWTVTLLNRRKSDTGATAEAVFAGLFVAAALYIFLNEGARNWQSLWTSGAFFLFGTALWRSRSVAVLSRMPAVFSKPLRKAAP